MIGFLVFLGDVTWKHCPEMGQYRKHSPRGVLRNTFLRHSAILHSILDAFLEFNSKLSLQFLCGTPTNWCFFKFATSASYNCRLSPPYHYKRPQVNLKERLFMCRTSLRYIFRVSQIYSFFFHLWNNMFYSSYSVNIFVTFLILIVFIVNMLDIWTKSK